MNLCNNYCDFNEKSTELNLIKNHHRENNLKKKRIL